MSEETNKKRWVHMIDQLEKEEKNMSDKVIRKQQMTEKLYIKFIADYYKDEKWHLNKNTFDEPNFYLIKKTAEIAACEFFD